MAVERQEWRIQRWPAVLCGLLPPGRQSLGLHVNRNVAECLGCIDDGQRVVFLGDRHYVLKRLDHSSYIGCMADDDRRRIGAHQALDGLRTDTAIGVTFRDIQTDMTRIYKGGQWPQYAVVLGCGGNDMLARSPLAPELQR